MIRYVPTLILLAAFASHGLRADFYVQVKDASPATYLPGGTGVLEVWGRHTEGLPIDINGWTLSFQLSNLSVWNLANTSPSNAITGAAMSYFNDPSFSPNNYDFGFQTNTNGSVSMNPNQNYKLFDINFEISGSAAPGTYNLDFVAAALNNFLPLPPVTVEANSVAYNGFSQYLSPSGNPPLLANPVVGFQGQFTVVPEPSSIMLSTLVIAGLGFYRKRGRSL